MSETRLLSRSELDQLLGLDVAQEDGELERFLDELDPIIREMLFLAQALNAALVLSERARDPEGYCTCGPEGDVFVSDPSCVPCGTEKAADAALADLRPKGWGTDGTL